MHLQALAAVTDPSLAEVTDRADHGQAGGEDPGMSNKAIARLQHAFDLSALRADRQPLHALAEVAEGARLLLPASGEVDIQRLVGFRNRDT